MKVIITKDNSIKDVNEGYFRNYLLPKGLAIIATPQELQKRQAQLAQDEAKRKEQDQEDRLLMAELDGKSFTIGTAKVGKNGKLNGSVTTKEISEKTQISKVYLQLDAPIKEPGTHIIKLKIGQYHGRITVTIVKEGLV